MKPISELLKVATGLLIVALLVVAFGFCLNGGF
jgi:hypothetical protein